MIGSAHGEALVLLTEVVRTADDVDEDQVQRGVTTIATDLVRRIEAYLARMQEGR